jgi:SAM-dependent methyltransferase
MDAHPPPTRMNAPPMVELTPSLVRDMPKNGPSDPIEYYRRPLVGWLFRERINLGLRLLPRRRYERALELGYGAGALQLALAGSVGELHGIDLDADPAVVARILATQGLSSHLVRGSIYELPYEDCSFDLIFCFSVFEHLHEYQRGLAEVTRVLRPGGLFLLGMPSVSPTMEVGFRLIGFDRIDDHHVTTPASVERAFGAAGLRVSRRSFLDVPFGRPLGLRLYHNWLLEKAGT